MLKQIGRIGLFLLTNIFVMLTISIVLNVLGVGQYITASGLDYNALMMFCLVWGMAGSLISLAMSRTSAKWMMGVRVIDPNQPGQFAWLVNTVHETARRAGLPAMPEVGVFDSPDVNAFATGPTKARSLVAVSTGLLSNMDRGGIEGVIGHEVAHIQNGDMVTMTLIQGVVNAFVMFLSRVISFAIASQVEERNRYWVRGLITFALEVLIGFLGMIIVAWFSRKREFRADAGSAKLVGREHMLSGLKSLQRVYGHVDQAAPESLASLQISSSRETDSWRHLFATHPPLAQRIRALETMGA